MIGVLLGNRYRLDAPLGRGGTGVVYRAHDTLLDRDVAVKVLSAAYLAEESRARLLREARAAAQLNHPHVVSVYDAGEAELPGLQGPVPYAVMELVEGPSLRERPPSRLEETLGIALQVCAALEHAHAHGIVHRDLKPENVLLAPDGTAKLNDFGLARSMASRITTEGTIAGTVFYLAPEVALGQPFDGRADLYALGVLLYELATGDLPFVADDPIAVISQHLYAPVVSPRARKPDIPPALDALIVRLLSKQPEDRPGSAAEVRAALARMASGEAAEEAAGESGRPALLDRIVRGRMVGREQEIAQARAVWKRAAAGEGQVLLVSGEPGIGKTRLVRELLTQVQVAGARALLGECYAEGGEPYAPFAQVVEHAQGDGDRLDLPDWVLADLLALAPALRLRFPGVAPNPPLAPQAEQQRLFESVLALCTALAARSPLLLVVEDAHWADSGSLALLRHLARRTRRLPLLLVATYREVELAETRPLHDVLADLHRERLATRLKLTRLGLAGTRDLLAALFAEEITPEFLEGIYRETEGNPFFVEEVCKALVESGELDFSGGRWHRPDMQQLGIPESLRMAILSRVSRLPQRVQSMLHLAAILGREFEFDTLAAAGELDDEALVEALEVAEHAQLIQEIAGRKHVTFAFAHGLIPATLEEEVHTLRRRRLHRSAAAAIERLRPDDSEALAHHWAAAGDDERALAYTARAGDRALAAYANVEAERHYRAALELAAAPTERAHLLSGLGRALAHQSRVEEALQAWREAIDLYDGQGDRDSVSRCYAQSARAAWDAGETPRGLAICREALARAADAPESIGLADLLHEAARACLFNGLPDEARILCERALGAAERQGAVAVQAQALITSSFLLGTSVDEAIAALARALELAEAAGLLAEEHRAQHNLGFTLAGRGHPVQARAHFLRAAELAHRMGSAATELYSRAAAAYCLLFLGDLAQVEQELRALHGLLETVPPLAPAAIEVQWLEACLLRSRGDLQPAIEQWYAVRDTARAAGDLQWLSRVTSDLIEALLELNREAEAEALLQEAFALEVRWIGASGTLAMALHGARQGRSEAARGLLDRVRTRVGVHLLDIADLAGLDWAEGWIAVSEQRWAEAWACFERALGRLTSAGMRWQRARLLCDWAEASLARGQAGDAGQAIGLLREAAEEFEAMGAPLYARKVEERLRELRGG